MVSPVGRAHGTLSLLLELFIVLLFHFHVPKWGGLEKKRGADAPRVTKTT
jgi:hypothetical protein